MDLVEVLERLCQLAQDGAGVSPIHPAHIVPFEGVQEAIGNVIALRVADRRSDGFEPQFLGHRLGLARDLGAAVV